MNNNHTQRWNRKATITALLAVISLASAQPANAALDVDGFPVNAPTQRHYVRTASVV